MTLGSENPRVGSSILSLATIIIRNVGNKFSTRLSIIPSTESRMRDFMVVVSNHHHMPLNKQNGCPAAVHA